MIHGQQHGLLGILKENIGNNYLDGEDIRTVLRIHTGVITSNVTHINNSSIYGSERDGYWTMNSIRCKKCSL